MAVVCMVTPCIGEATEALMDPLDSMVVECMVVDLEDQWVAMEWEREWEWVVLMEGKIQTIHMVNHLLLQGFGYHFYG